LRENPLDFLRIVEYYIFMADKRSGKEAPERPLGHLGHLEQEVMEVLWAEGEASGKEVFDRIRRRRKIAITTVLTVMERLTRKGLLKKEKGATVYLYRPALSRDEFAKRVSDTVLRGIMEISRSSAAASLVDMLAEADPEELERL